MLNKGMGKYQNRRIEEQQNSLYLNQYVSLLC